MVQVCMRNCRYCPDKNAATSVNGTSGCSIYFLGRLYDGVSSKRRGVTSLSLPKPKLHLTLNQPVSPSAHCAIFWNPFVLHKPFEKN